MAPLFLIPVFSSRPVLDCARPAYTIAPACLKIPSFPQWEFLNAVWLCQSFGLFLMSYILLLFVRMECEICVVFGCGLASCVLFFASRF